MTQLFELINQIFGNQTRNHDLEQSTDSKIPKAVESMKNFQAIISATSQGIRGSLS